MLQKKWKIAYVCPRYAPQSAGGAEVLIQSWAERMQQRGHHSEVLTTCARNHFTWENEYPPGIELIHEVPVRRFLINDRNPKRQLALQDRIMKGQKLKLEEEEDWINAGANSDSLCQYIRDHLQEFDFFIFTPYLFGITYNGVKSAPGKSILVPCLHNEPYAYLGIMRDLFSSARGILFNSRPESNLANRLFRLEDRSISVVGVGVESPPVLQPDSFRRKFEIKAPFLLYAGRREGGKNTPLLIEYFRVFKRHHKINLNLILIGTGEVGLVPEDEGSIIDLGYLGEEDKWNCYAAALAFCQPSTNESFSIVLLESWLAQRPALVNAGCPVTLDHCIQAQGGLYFQNYYEFEECLLYLIEDPNTADRMGQNGREYVLNNYSWEVILDRLEKGLGKCLEPVAKSKF